MALPDIFNRNVCDQITARINQLSPNSKPIWGKMNVQQMLAHCNVTYEMIFEDNHPKPGGLMKWILKTFVKGSVVSEKPYKHNSGTGPQFLIRDDRNFELEKKRLIDYIDRTQALGVNAFNGKESHSFGPLNVTQWNNMLYKHLDHHLQQFGV